jgi:hypothetical protein
VLILRTRVSTFFQKRFQSANGIERENGFEENASIADQTENDVVGTSGDDDRWAVPASHVDLSGTWRPIVTPEFKQEYDEYLLNCSQSFIFRKVVVNGISLQKETIRQVNGDLEIIATSNPAGNWNRTLVASDAIEPFNITIKDPDGDTVQVEAWWAEEGTRHTSWLGGKPRVQGGSFETVRYLENEDILVCESSFHPSPTASASMNFKYGHVKWRFKREK